MFFELWNVLVEAEKTLNEDFYLGTVKNSRQIQKIIAHQLSTKNIFVIFHTF